MAEFLKWDPASLSVKVSAMDDEHQELIRRMNALHAAFAEQKPTTEIRSLLLELKNYTLKHFADEEAYMERIGFEGLSTHKIIHQQLLKQFGEHAEQFEKKQALSDAFFDFLAIWLTSHIKGIDTKYGAAGQKRSA